jgi:gliding motility-associated lipoprotein GldH
MMNKRSRKFKPSLRENLFILAVFCSFFSGCGGQGNLNVFEKNVPIPSYQWEYSFHPAFDVRITDTAARYNIAVTVRHMESYAFSNLWLLVTSAYEGVRPKTSRVELPLADREGRWFGSGIDGIFEHRIPIQQNARFDKAGTYHFSFAQDMRVNPLAGIMSVGLRVEKIPAR